MWFDSDPDQSIAFGDYKTVTWHCGGAVSLAKICSLVGQKLGREVHILLPGYFCGQSLRYLRSSRFRIHFYPLTSHLLPDYDYITTTLALRNIDVFVHVHYFGTVVGQQASRSFCDSVDAIMVEDCAHVISPFVGYEWYGDHLFFCPHKHFALPPVSATYSRTESDLEARVQLEFPYSWLVRQLAKTIFTFSTPARYGKVWTAKALDVNFIETPNRRVIGSAISYMTNYLSAATLRKERASVLLQRSRIVSGWMPLQTYESETVPFVVGMLCDTAERARHRFYILNRDVQLVMQWPDFPAEIGDYSFVLEQCCGWVDRVLYFFVHQQLGMAEWLSRLDAAILADGF